MIDSTALLSLVTVRDQESFSLVKDLEKIFLAQTPKLFQQMYLGIDLEKGDLISRAAHTLRTSCRYLGILDMVELSQQIEIQASNENVDLQKISELLQKLERAYFEGIVELKTLIASLGNQASN